MTEIEGNLSARLSRDLFLVSPRHLPYHTRTPKDIVLLDPASRVIGGAREPTSELRMHLAIYKAREDVGAVIHSHPVYASVLALAGIPIVPIPEEAVSYVGGRVEVSDPAPAGSDELAEAAVRALGSKSAALLANHGAVCVGKDLPEAFRTTRNLEKWAKITVLARILTQFGKDHSKT